MLDVALFILAFLVAIPIAIVCAEYIAAVLYHSTAIEANFARPAISVLVPAHNEEQPLGKTLESIQTQLHPGDHVLVVADNCDDATANIARSMGAHVLERHDEVNRGKGFAIDAGLRYLERNELHGEFVVMIDADCTLDDHTLDRLVAKSAATNRPVQGTYLMHRPADASAAAVVSEFAFTLKNHARALGDEVLGWPCVLRGSGMAFPWETLRNASVASDHIVEDVKMGLDLTLEGKGPLFCPEAFIRSELPTSQSASTTQRTRWEHGYLSMVSQTPRLLGLGLLRQRWQLIGTAAILSIPPLSMHCAGWVACFILALVAWLVGWASIWPTVTLAVLGGVFFLCTLMAWYKFARQDIPFAALLAIPGYVLGKIPIYLRFFTRRERKWVRTSRT